MATEDEGSSPKRGPSIGEAIGGWARRVSELVQEVSGSPPVPENAKEPLARARERRLEGDVAGAIEMLRDIVKQAPDEPHGRLALGLSLVHDLVIGGRPLKELAEAIAALEAGSLAGEPVELLRGAHALYDGKPDAALDHLRRAARGTGSIAKDDVPEVRFFVHLLAALTQLARGEEDRALRDLQKAKARLPGPIAPHLRTVLLSHGVQLLLAADELRDAELWLKDALNADERNLAAREQMVRVLAAKGDRVGAHSMLETLGDDAALDATRLFVGLTVGLPADEPDPMPVIAMRALQQDPGSVGARRAWALGVLADATTEDGEVELEEGMRGEVLSALDAACETAPRATRDRFLQELAHVVLRVDALGSDVVQRVLKRLDREGAPPPEELRLVRGRHRIAHDDAAMSEDFITSTPPRFRADPDVGGSSGPDPTSPARDPDLRDAVLASQRALAAAELSHRRGQEDAAQDLLVEALVELPGLRRARTLLAELTHPRESHRLEELLTGATSLLAGVPNRVLGVSLEAIQEAMHEVVAARERLARPLTIAIMGEFSAGKSTFVNALLGEAVAPMGVLPTTSTINVFRRGGGGGARVHYRDGRIATLAIEDVQPFLHGLDSTDAATIRHVELERSGERMGEARVVDTPGLNALDTFHEEVAREFLDEADAVVWLFSATRTGAATEVGMLASLRAGGRQVLGVLNKVDTLEDAEKTELAEYLRDQLGEVLVEVVPLCARDALEWRTGDGEGDDPFAPVERALERHFLEKARELKRSLTMRRFDEALVKARKAALEAVAQLEGRAEQALRDVRGERGDVSRVLADFAQKLHGHVLGLDDTLTREGLGLGVLVAGRGRRKGDLDPLDREYLETCVRDGLIDALRQSLGELGSSDPAALDVLDRSFVPWAQGHIEGLLQAGFVETTLEDHGKKIAEGEAPMRAAFRESLQPTADAWAARARLYARDVAKARARRDREASSAPRAEAMRLRSAVVTAVDGLRGALEGVS